MATPRGYAALAPMVARDSKGGLRCWHDHPGVSAVAELLNTTAFTERVGHYGGYDLAHCGEPVDTQ